MATETRHSSKNEQRLMGVVVLTASGPPAESLTVRPEPVPQPGLEVAAGAAQAASFTVPDGAGSAA